MNDLTKCVLTPRVSTEGFDPLGVGVHRASTIVFADAAAYAARGERGENGYSYGLYGTPTTRTLEEKLNQLEGAKRSFLVPSGQAANTLAVLPLVATGDHILIADTAYPPMRDFADQDLCRLGVEVEYFDPQSADDVAQKIKINTKLVWCESPGSTTMEIMDLPQVIKIAHRANVLVGVDNTWATPLNLKPLVLGADIVTEGLTKYVSGHSDVLMGSISVSDDALGKSIHSFIGRMGIGVSSDDVSLVLRGFETFGMRMKHSSAVALRFAQRLENHPMVKQVLHPSLANFPNHDIFKRDFLGASAVFTLTFPENVAPHIFTALDAFDLFAIGASWGGTRSLVAPMPVRANRTATNWNAPDLTLRISIGLEDEAELWDDVEKFLTSLTNNVENAK